MGTLLKHLKVDGTSRFQIPLYGFYSKKAEEETYAWVELEGVSYYDTAEKGDSYGVLLFEKDVSNEQLLASIASGLFLASWPEKVEVVVGSVLASYNGFSHMLECKATTVFGWRKTGQLQGCLAMADELRGSEAWATQLKRLAGEFSHWDD